MALDRGRRLRQLPYDDYLVKARNQINSGIAKVTESGCWIWGRNHMTNGYGQTRFLGRQTPAHRASYMAFVGTIESGKEVCHRCDVRDCVNPDHLFIASHAENMLDQKTKGRTNNGVLSGAYVPKHDPATGRFLKMKGL